MIPRTRSAVILLTNSEHLNPGAIHNTILRLLIDDLKKPAAPGVPKVEGPPPKEAALDFLHQMQSGKVDRGKLGEEFGVFLTDDRLKRGGPAAEGPGRAGDGRGRERLRTRGHGGRLDPLQIQDDRAERAALPDARREDPAALVSQGMKLEALRLDAIIDRSGGNPHAKAESSPRRRGEEF